MATPGSDGTIEARVSAAAYGDAIVLLITGEIGRVIRELNRMSEAK
jgi:hypothetical protein